MFKESGSENSSVAETTLISPTMPSSPTTSACMELPAVQDFTTIEEARKIIRDLRHRYRAQAQQLLAWRRAHKIQEDLVCRLQREKAEQLKCLSSKLILFESRLIRKQKDISALLNHREIIIMRQQRIIDVLTNRLIENGLETSNPDLTDLDTNMPDMDSLNDSDSAVIMEDIDSDSAFSQIVPRFRSASADGAITVCRSISDAIDPSLKYTSCRRSNGFLRRPEILETVYSVEEDGESEQNNPQNNSDTHKRPYLNNHHDSNERLDKDNSTDSEDKPTRTPLNQVTTYNRVMSNHRSVTKPKDVKYKRINKAKSKSLEELRGRLRNWVEHGNRLAGISLDQTQSFA
ncbi:uncharacterized protein LOC123291714 [Chrysoperla carnea]|uniref:uncharacterized protein LOC123291714 n=1 Tax=Chrysoperla carnea TaxID=189513 RepID=UPI001D061ED4|nr:uncharacterized protein LOC123291714 [Chrysoperla carnea]